MQLRQGLVVFQFVMSSIMIIGFIAISRQIEFIRNSNLGFDQENVLMIPNVIGVQNPETIVEEFSRISSVESVGWASGGIIGSRNSVNGIADAQGANHITLNFLRVDYNYIPTLKIKMKEGRNFSKEFVSDSTGIVINEAAVGQMGLKQPVIGQKLMWDDAMGKTHDVTVIGVAMDFHFTSFHEAIEPFGFVLEPNNGSTLFLRIHSGLVQETLAEVEKVWKSISPDKPFDYSFQDEQMARLHILEERFQRLFTAFTILAIVISCLGLFGLITAIAEAKTKEIGIRKVLGSSVIGIVILLTKEFMTLIVLAFVVAAPLAFFLTENWLQQFAYRIDMTWSLFVFTAVLTFAVAFLTVCLQSVKAALANPVDSLRNE
jgi:putative ABC transport system permease protein